MMDAFTPHQNERATRRSPVGVDGLVPSPDLEGAPLLVLQLARRLAILEVTTKLTVGRWQTARPSLLTQRLGPFLFGRTLEITV